MHLDLDALETSFDLVAPRGEELMDVFDVQAWRAEYAHAWAVAFAVVACAMLDGASALGVAA